MRSFNLTSLSRTNLSPPASSPSPDLPTSSTSSCFFLSLSAIPSSAPCEALSRTDQARIEVAANWAICEIKTAGTGIGKVPRECDDWQKGGRGGVAVCVEALARSPQHWSSYSQNLREVVTLCSSYRRWADLGLSSSPSEINEPNAKSSNLETARSLYASTASTFSSFLDHLKVYESARSTREASDALAHRDMSSNLSSLASSLTALTGGLSADHSRHSRNLELLEKSLATSISSVESKITSYLESQINTLLSSVSVHQDKTAGELQLVLGASAEEHGRQLALVSREVRDVLGAAMWELRSSVGGLVVQVDLIDEGIRRSGRAMEESSTVNMTASPNSQHETPAELRHFTALAIKPAKVILVSSDAVDFVEDATFLASHSEVFKNMLLLSPSDQRDQRCAVAETSKQLTLMLATLHGTSAPPSFDETRTLCSLSDKYESPLLEAKAVTGLWQHLTCQPLEVYSLAVMLHQKELSVAAATSTLQLAYFVSSDLSSAPKEFTSLPEADRYRLQLYHLRLINCARLALIKPYMTNYCKCTGGFRQRPGCNSDIEIWDACVLACLKNLLPSSNAYTMIRDEVRDAAGQYSECVQCTKRLLRKVEEVGSAWKYTRGEIKLVSTPSEFLRWVLNQH
ncbi:hypothetical protein P7C70_g3558, partial [Phenoliferia sp. Uapishka_3]